MKWSQVPWGIVVPALLGAYGTILSTYNVIVQVRRDRRCLKVTVGMGLAALDHPTDPTTLLTFEVSNVGFRPIHVATIYLALPGNKNMFLPRLWSRPDLPCKLEEGQGLSAYVRLSDVAASLQTHGIHGSIKVRACCKDGTGTVHESEQQDLDAIALLNA